MQQIIEYAYAYSVLVTTDNVENLLAAADQLNILGIVQMARMDLEYFMKNIKMNDLVKANAACKPIVNDVLRAMYELEFKSPNSENPLTRPRQPSDILLAIGGWVDHPTTWIDAYDSRADRWVDVTQVERRQSGHGTVYLNGYVYCIGGFDGLMRFNTAERYDPETNERTIIQPMHERRHDASATTLNGKIYICGGYNGADTHATVECYDPLTGEWTIIALMSTRPRGLRVAAYHGKIYVVSDSFLAP
ncbi:kelch-like protein 10 [Brienomyrus brachyistius]|uniref:kelch-like protein 10 n=1 Tax=Brienomyrus brachyistius TaxID=42636 RepID=UPI0020B1CA9D|nr:kelch-like protein 10 [Brienomyrus brachyistius]